MLNRMANFLVRSVERWMPDPFIFCVLLTVLCYVTALMLTPSKPAELVTQWYNGLWEILPFTMQVILILLTGYAVAKSPRVHRLLDRIASIPSSQGSAIVLLTVIISLAVLIHWGFGLVAAGLLARAIARKVPACDFGFLVAGAYSGLVIGASGLSASIALVSATPGSKMNFIAQYTGVEAVSLSETLFSPMNLALVAGMLVTLPLMFRLMMPRGDQIRTTSPELLVEPMEDDPTTIISASQLTPAQRLERSPLILCMLVLLGGIFLFRHFATRGFALDLNVVILLFLLLGMTLHARPVAYVRSFNQAAHLAGPIALQFPLYGGIMGMMQHSGLAAVISDWFVSISNHLTFPFFCFLSAVLLNFGIPSAGGHWVVQGPSVIPAALKLGVSPASTAMAIAYGEQTCNMLQPFWALPILAIARLGVRDIMGYCVMTFLLSAFVSALVLFLLA